ncbi:MAG: hypothetical protein AAGA48_15485 [Myxococcota bacterium]
MDNELGIVVGGLFCGGLSCIGIAMAILGAVALFYTRSQADQADTPRIEPRPDTRSNARTVLVQAEDPPQEPEPDLFDEEAMATVVSPPSGSLPSAPPPPPPAPPARPKRGGRTIIAFDDDDE